MLQILALLFGLCSWAILVFKIVKRKDKKEQNGKLYSLSWFFCSVALYIPSLCQFLEFRADDFGSVIDCAATYHLLSVFLLIGTMILTILSFLMQKEEK